MAKVSFTKLGLKKNEDVETIEWNEQKIEVKQYLPIEDKLKLITAIVQNSIDDNGYYNPAKIYVYTIVEMINFYTNINFTEKQKTDIAKTYDLIVSSGFSAKVFEAINPYEYNQLKSWVGELITSIYEYKNSIYGIMESLGQDFKDLNLEATEIEEKIGNKENLKLLKEVMDKMGS